MTFLQMVQALRRECSVSGTGPTTVVSQTGEYSRLINWVQEAYETIQQEYFDWFFLWNQATIDTIASTSTITNSNTGWPTDVNIWDKRRFYIGNTPLNVYEYAEFVPRTETSGQPQEVYIMPDNTLKLVPTPDDVYQITTDYFSVPGTVSVDADTFLIPDRFQKAILGKAMTYYGYYEPAPEILQRGEMMYQTYFRSLYSHQLSFRQQFTITGSPEIVVAPE